MKTMNGMSTANPRTCLPTTSATVAILVFTSLINGVVTQTPGVRPIADPQPKSYFDIFTHTAQRLKYSHTVTNSSFASALKSSMLDLHRLGYEKVIAHVLREIYPAEDKSQLITKSPTSVYKEKFLRVTDFLRQSNQSFANISMQCIGDFARILIGAVEREKWIIPFLDSGGKPGVSLTQGRLNWVGNYKQCRASRAPRVPGCGLDGFQGNYCVLKVSPNIMPLFLIRLGSCVPSTCTNQDLTSLVAYGLQFANLTSVLSAAPAECRTDEREVTTATVMAILVLSMLSVLLLAGTVYDVVLIQRPKWSLEGMAKNRNLNWPAGSQVEEDGEAAESAGSDSDIAPLTPKDNESAQGSIAKVLLAFSVYTNAKKLLDTSQTSDSLSAIHGIRFFTIAWVILGHTHLYSLLELENLNVFQTVMKRWSFDVVSNAFPSVDTFFALSGLLISYVTIRQMMAKSWRLNWPMFYFHRIWRLTPPYMLVILIALGLQRFLGSGALWASEQPIDKKYCEDNWWTNLLYVNNLHKADEPCLAHTWFLANAMQFFIVSPLMIVPFYFNTAVGVGVCMLFLFVSWTTTGALSTQNKWGAYIFPQHLEIEALRGYWTDFYVAPWCRIGPYVIGIMAGYLLAVSQGGKQIAMRWWMVVLGWTLATASGLAVVYGIDGDISGHHPSSVGVAALYNAMSHSVWGACVCWVIVACASGYGGPVNTLLSWTPFVFLGKLTYMVYLTHPILIITYFMNRETLFFLNDTNVAIVYLGILMSSYVTSFVLMLALESPWVGLEKLFIRKDARA